jgi:hypothetical protein
MFEIGCGNGLIYVPLAQEIASYKGTDISAAAIDSFHHHIATSVENVTLETRPADTFDAHDTRMYDTVVCNSVTQHFPSQEYLVRTLDHAIEAVQDGGNFFLGDVRSNVLAEDFCALVALHHTSDTDSFKDFQMNVQNRLDHEEELIIDPYLFVAYAQKHPRISSVNILMREDEAINEMNQYRYDVIFAIGETKAHPSDIPWEAWETFGTLDTLRARLQTCEHTVFGIKNIPNIRWIENTILNEYKAEHRTASFKNDLQEAVAERTHTFINPGTLSAYARTLDIPSRYSFQKNVRRNVLMWCLYLRDTRSLWY